MRYEIMGPLRIVDGENVLVISARKIATVLAVLLIRSDLVVPRDQLSTEIWGDRPPRRATDGVHVYISQLRKFLHRPDRPESPVVTQYPGYLLRQGSDEIDLHIFADLVSQGRSLARQQRHEQAMGCFERALRLWRGLLVGDLRGGPIIEGFGTWLLESRLECLELLAESSLLLGRHRELIGQLYALTSEYPLREAFHRQLMLALYRSERQADALKAYQVARMTLREELGLEPGQTLRNLHRAILAADIRLDATDAGPPRPSAASACAPGSLDAPAAADALMSDMSASSDLLPGRSTPAPRPPTSPPPSASTSSSTSPDRATISQHNSQPSLAPPARHPRRASR